MTMLNTNRHLNTASRQLGTLNKEKALVGTISVIVETFVKLRCELYPAPPQPCNTHSS